MAFLRLLRLQQWAKNLLIFVPILLAHWVDHVTAWEHAALAFVAFSLLASSVYIVNDLLDRDADRDHPRKRHRPLASGAVSPGAAILLAVALTALGFGISLLLPAEFRWIVLVYVILAHAYSLSLKRVAVLDAILLGAMYAIRVFAGGAAIGVVISPATLAFLVFLCFSLALVKRVAELRQPDAALSGVRRGYAPGDETMLATLGAASGYLAVIVLVFYISSNEVRRIYQHPEYLWLLTPVLLYWISRVWLLAGRGKLHDDPLDFALRDWPSYAVLALGVFIVFLATK